MKKCLFLVVIAFLVFCFSSCEKNCACIMPGEEQPTIIEISPTEDCDDYSDPSRGLCR